MAEETPQDSEAIMKKNDAQDTIEYRVKAAMISRASHFKEQADSLTFEGVRRLIENDLGMEIHTLDVHKKFVKQCLVECMDGNDDANASKNSGTNASKNTEANASKISEANASKNSEADDSKNSEANASRNSEASAAKNFEESVKENVSCTKEDENSPQRHQSRKEVKEPDPDNEEKLEDSPVLGLMTGNKKIKPETEIQDDGRIEAPNEITVKKAVRKRAVYIKANIEKITMAGLRRLLEEDLKLDKGTLNPFKKMIGQELDEVLKSSEFSEPSTVTKKRSDKKNVQNKAKRVDSEGSSNSSDEMDDEEDEVKPRKKLVSKGKMQNFEGLKKRKRPLKETNPTNKKKTKAVKTASASNSDAKDSGSVSDDGHSQSSAEKPIKKKEVSAPAYGKRVDHLKTVIKSCGMSVPPSVYKKVKQAPENKREAQLIRELEAILSKEGLSSDPSEKEIKEVKKRKERARELEGIDMSNIVSSSRRRSTTSFVPPPKPKIAYESESSDTEEDEDDDSDNGDDEVIKEEDDNGDSGSQSEEIKEADAEDSD